MSVCSYHVTHAFQSESTLYSCMNVKELLTRSKREIWSLSDCNWTRTHNNLVHKQTLNHLAKLASLVECSFINKWLWVRVQLQWIMCFPKGILALPKIRKPQLKSFFVIIINRCLRSLQMSFKSFFLVSQ